MLSSFHQFPKLYTFLGLAQLRRPVTFLFINIELMGTSDGKITRSFLLLFEIYNLMKNNPTILK
jgi:hypothetical protein